MWEKIPFQRGKAKYHWVIFSDGTQEEWTPERLHEFLKK
jgi:hypothetical protein